MNGKCDICGQHPSPYPNWIFSKGRGMHVGCLEEAFDRAEAEATRLREALEPIPGVLSALLAWGLAWPEADGSYWMPRCKELIGAIAAALKDERRP